eukprot:1292018-Rhodomonas_salina.1
MTLPSAGRYRPHERGRKGIESAAHFVKVSLLDVPVLFLEVAHLQPLLVAPDPRSAQQDLPWYT